MAVDFLSFYSFAVYVGSSIYAPATELVIYDFDIGAVAGVLPFAIYVLACKLRHGITYQDVLMKTDGIGPMLFSPLSE